MACSSASRLVKTVHISPEQYEQRIRSWLESAAGTLQEFGSIHREFLPGSDDYDNGSTLGKI